MTFLHPEFLQIGAGMVLLVLAGAWSHARRRKRLGKVLGGRGGTKRLARTRLDRPPLTGMLLLALGGSSIALAGADLRPIDAEEEEPPPPARSVVIALDVSASMQAGDVLPSRLGRSVELVGELLTGLREDRVGLLLFAGTVYPLASPTHDHAALRYLLGGLTPSVASAYDPGTLLAVALSEGARLLREHGEEGGERAIILMGDGESGDDEAELLEVAREVAQDGIRIITVGVGTEEGAEVRMPAAAFQLGGILIGPDGSPVRSRLEEGAFLQLAELGSGQYVRHDHPSAMEDLLRILGSAPSQVPETAPPEAAWTSERLLQGLVLSALLLILAESLLHVRLPWRALVPARRPT